MRNSILEGQARYNQIGIALWLGAEHQYRLLRRSRAECQNTVDIDRCEICGGNAKILHQQPCAGLDIERGIEEEQRLVGVTALQHMRNLPPHAMTCIDTQDNTIRIARELISLRRGERIPRVQDYARKLRVGYGTVQAALHLLENVGAVKLASGTKR